MKPYIAEFIGSALLLAIVAGSGYMGEILGNGNAAVALLGNSIATGVGLYVLIVLLGPISGAHLNPVVSLMFWKLGHLDFKKLVTYWACQFSGAMAGIYLTHLMFSLPILNPSLDIITRNTHIRQSVPAHFRYYAQIFGAQNHRRIVPQNG